MSIYSAGHEHEAPTGVSPQDRSEPIGPDFGRTSPVPHEPTGGAQRGSAPYQNENWKSLQVFERSSEEWDAYIVSITAQNGGTVIAAPKQKGRKSVTLSIPTSLPNGWTAVQVIFGPTEDSVQNQINGAVLNPGDSVTINTEAAVYIGFAATQTTGYVQVMTESNPAGGGLL